MPSNCRCYTAQHSTVKCKMLFSFSFHSIQHSLNSTQHNSAQQNHFINKFIVGFTYGLVRTRTKQSYFVPGVHLQIDLTK